MKITNRVSNHVSTIQVYDDSFEYNCIIEVYRDGSIEFEKGSLRSIEKIKYIEYIHYLYFIDFMLIIDSRKLKMTIKKYDDDVLNEYDLTKPMAFLILVICF